MRERCDFAFEKWHNFTLESHQITVRLSCGMRKLFELLDCVAVLSISPSKHSHHCNSFLDCSVSAHRPSATSLLPKHDSLDSEEEQTFEIILYVLIGFLVLLLVVVAVFFVRRRKKHPVKRGKPGETASLAVERFSFKLKS